MREMEKPKRTAYQSEADLIESGRMARLDDFETRQMSVFVSALAKEMFLDESCVWSLIHYAACQGLQEFYLTKDETGRVYFQPERHLSGLGRTPVELCYKLAHSYIYDFKMAKSEANWSCDDKRADILAKRNAIQHLSRILFYNDPANRFLGTA